MKFIHAHLAGILTSVLALASASAFAGTSQGPLTQVFAMPEGILVFTAGEHKEKPACSTSGDAWAVSTLTEAGKAIQAKVMAAATSGQTIRVIGTGSCSARSDREEPASVE